MLLVPVPWAARVWALPFLTALAPSERYHAEQGKWHKKLTDWARQMFTAVRRWLPERDLVAVADSGYAALALLHRLASLARPVTVVTRLRLDAALYEPAPPRKPRQNGRPRKKGARLPTLAQVLADPATAWDRLKVMRWYSQGERAVEATTGVCVWFHGGMPPVPIRWVLLRDPQGKFAPQALLCTHISAAPEQIVFWFVLRWQREATFQEARTHLGVETQRQWSEKAVARETPCLLGQFSLVTLLAKPYVDRDGVSVRQAGWYRKRQATFSDTLALVRRHLWREAGFCASEAKPDTTTPTADLIERLTQTLCYAA